MNELNYANRKEEVGVVRAKNIAVAQSTKILLWIEKENEEIVKEDIKTFIMLSKKLPGYITKSSDIERRNNGSKR